jgi:26S proteasome regulatory subunit N6
MFESVTELLQSNDKLFSEVPKAKTAKIVRTIIDIVATAPDSLDLQVALCKEVVAWCNREKRTFLRQRIESKLGALLLEQGQYQEALTLMTALLRELKKLDDKQMLVEAHLTESRLHHALSNIPKAKAALTAARTAANAIYVAPITQAELDEMSGVLHCEEEDHTTAFSYFLEAFEAYNSSNDSRAVSSLKYMMLTKVLQGNAADVPSITAGKWGLKYTGEELDAMTAVAAAAKKRSLEDFERAVQQHSAHLHTDTLIRHHLDLLYERMLDANLLKIIRPFSCIEIDHVATLINLPLERVERKLSQMILDGTLSGILDQGKGHLIVHDPRGEDPTFSLGTQVLSNMGLVVDELFNRARGLMRGQPSADKKAKDKQKDAPADNKEAAKAS